MRHLESFVFTFHFSSGETYSIPGELQDTGVNVRHEMVSAIEAALKRIPEILDAVEEADKQDAERMN